MRPAANMYFLVLSMYVFSAEATNAMANTTANATTATTTTTSATTTTNTTTTMTTMTTTTTTTTTNTTVEMTTTTTNTTTTTTTTTTITTTTTTNTTVEKTTTTTSATTTTTTPTTTTTTMSTTTTATMVQVYDCGSGPPSDPLAIPTYLDCISSASCEDSDASWLQDLSTVPLVTCAGIVPETPCGTPLAAAFELLAQQMNKTLPATTVSALAVDWTINNVCCATCASVTTTTVTTTIAYSKFTGTMSITLEGINASVMKQAATTTIAAHFAVDFDRVSVFLTEARRLNAGPRRLPGMWSVDYEFHASPAVAADVEAKVAAAASNPATFKADLKTQFKTHLMAQGVSESVADSMVVTQSSVQAAVTGMTTSMKPPTTTMEPVDLSSGAYKAAASMAVITTLNMLFWGM